MNGAPSTAQDDAIAAALSQNWDEAIRINLAILHEDSVNIDALNRLGFAYTQAGKTKNAKETYAKVLHIDGYNQIAQKNLSKLKNSSGGGNSTVSVASPLMFLEEPGKTKIVTCVNPAPAKTITNLVCGQEIQLKVKKHCIEIRDMHQNYLGALPDDVAFKLGKFIEGGNEYKVFVRSVGKNTLTVFLREISRGKKYNNQPSFIPATTFVSQSRVEEGERPDTTATGEENDD